MHTKVIVCVYGLSHYTHVPPSIPQSLDMLQAILICCYPDLLCRYMLP